MRLLEARPVLSANFLLAIAAQGGLFCIAVRLGIKAVGIDKARVKHPEPEGETTLLLLLVAPTEKRR